MGGVLFRRPAKAGFFMEEDKSQEAEASDFDPSALITTFPASVGAVSAPQNESDADES